MRFLLNNSLNSFVLRLFQVHRCVYMHTFNRPTYHLKHPKMEKSHEIKNVHCIFSFKLQCDHVIKFFK